MVDLCAKCRNNPLKPSHWVYIPDRKFGDKNGSPKKVVAVYYRASRKTCQRLKANFFGNCHMEPLKLFHGLKIFLTVYVHTPAASKRGIRFISYHLQRISATWLQIYSTFRRQVVEISQGP